MSELKICRVCLNTNVKGYSFSLSNLGEEYEDVTGVKIKPQDVFPRWVCFECAALLHKFHKFKEKCHAGQRVLERLLSIEPISYDSVSHLNRISENLHSKLSLFVSQTHTKTYMTKHKYKHRKKMKMLIVEEVLFYDDDAMKKEEKNDFFVYKPGKIEKDIKIKAELEQIEPETLPERPLAENETFNDIDTDIDNDTPIENDTPINNDVTMNENASTDDENIFLNIVKKAVNGENKLIFLDGVTMDKEITPKKKSNPKFMKPKKEYLSMEYWKKYSLTEEEAQVEFKQRESSEKYLKANYKCHNCFKGFSKLEMLMRHLKMKHEESLGDLECRFCRMRFRRKCMLSRHMRQHYAVYHCLRCDMRFRLETSAIFHDDWHSGVIRKCKQCGEEFKHSSTYYTHLRMAHRSCHVCTTCGASFVSDAGLAQHARIKHTFEDRTENSTDETVKNIYCEKCDVKFVSQNAYDLHLSHSNMHADSANDSQIKRRNATGHRTRMSTKKSRKPTTCIHCGKHFGTQAACMKHHLTEHPRKTFYPSDQRHICEVCGASLAAVSIASHMNRHTREHVYPCDVCGMQFISKSSHHRHQVTHTGERPYPCPLCEKRFTQKNSMQLHYRTFHLKQPYPKRNRKRKTDEMPLTVSRDEREALVTRWRITQ